MDPDLTPNCTATALADVEKSMQSSQIALQLLTLLFSILSVAFTYLSTSRFRSSPLPKNLRILMGFHHIALLVYTIPFSLNQGYHLITRIFYSDCALLVPVSRCVVLRIFQSAASVFFQFFYIAVLLNTFLNSFKFWSESQHSRWLGFLCWIIAGYATFPSVAVDHESKEFMLNCSSFEHKRNSVQKMIFLFFLSIDFASLLGLGFVYYYWKTKYSNPVLRLSISKKKRFEELQRVFRLILPNLLLNVGCYIYFAGLSIFMATEDRLDGNSFLRVNSVPFYTCVSPALWMYTLKRFKGKIEPEPMSSEFHFKILEQSWERNDPNKNKKREKVEPRRARKRSEEPTVSYVAETDVVTVIEQI